MDSQTPLSQTLTSPSSSPQIEPNLVNGVNGVNSDSDSEGFVSGEEDSEPTRPVLIYPDAKSTIVEQPLKDDDFPRPIAKITDDDEDVEEEDTHDDVVLEKGGGEKENSVEEVKEGDFSDSHEVFVEADDSGFDGGDSEEVEVVKEVVEEKKEDDGGTETNSSDSVVTVPVDNSESVVVENGVEDKEFTSGGDSVVETIQVNPLGSGGVAVVGDGVEELKESEIEGFKTSAPVVSLDNSFEPVQNVGESVLDVAVGGDDNVIEPTSKEGGGGDSVVETIQVNPLGSGGVAVVGDGVEELKESEIEGFKTSAPVVSLDNSFEPVQNVGGSVLDVAVGGDDNVIEPTSKEGGGDDVVDEVTVRDDNSSVPVEKGTEGVVDEVVGVDDNVFETTSKEGDGEGVVDEVAGVDDNSLEPVEKEKGSEGVVDEVAGVDDNVFEPTDKEGGDEGVVDVVARGDDNSSEPIEKEKDIEGVVDEVAGVDDNVFEPTNKEGGDEGVVDVVARGDDNSSEPIEKEKDIEGVVDEVAGVDDSVFEPTNKEGGGEGVVGEVARGGSSEPIEKEKGIEGVVDEVAGGDAEAVEGIVDEVAGQESDISPFEKVGNSEVAVQSVDHDIEAKTESRVDHAVEAASEGDKEVDHPIDREIGVDHAVEATGEGDEEVDHPIDREIDDSLLDKKEEGMIFGGSDSANKYLEELERQFGARDSSPDDRIDGQIVTDSDEEEETDDEGDSKELFDTATLAALLKAASGAGQDDGEGNITITSQDGSRLFSVERPAGLGSSLPSGKPSIRSNRPNLFTPSISRAATNTDINLSEEEKKKLERLQEIRIKFLRLVQRLGFTPEESMAAQVLYRLTLLAGRQTGELFSLDAAKESASQLETEGRGDLSFSINILVLGKTGVGKSATINSIFGETKTTISAYGPATTAVTEIVGVVDGVKIRVFDTPGLKASAFEQSYNRKVLSNVKKLTKKSPPDIVLYVDRLDLQTRDMNDLPMLRSITSALDPSIWRNVIVTLTHGASAPPDGPSGSPLSHDVFVAQRSHIVQQTIGQAVGDLRLMNPSLMNPVSLVENHPSCRKNRDGQKVLPNGQSWRPLLLLLCYSMKILSEAGNISKPQEAFDQRRLFGFRTRSPPLPYLLSWLLQSRAHPKLPADQGGADNGDSDIEMADLSDSDQEDGEDEYDQLPPFKPLKKFQLSNLNREQQKAYFEEYEYRVKLLQKKQWREELRRMKEMKKNGNTNEVGNVYMEEDDQENGSPAAVPVPLPDMVLPPSFDSDNPAYRYRFLEPTSQLLTRPVLDTHSWDHDCGYDGVNIENSLVIVNKFPTAVTVQVTKDKKDFSVHLDSSVAAKHGENGSTMAGFDIQNIGKQLAYIVRGETKMKTFKRNRTAAGFSVTFLGENVSTGLKVEDQIALGKRLVLVGSTGTVRAQGDSAYGANVEVRVREADFPVGQDQSSLSLSLVKWRGDLALGANLQSQFSVGRSYKMAVRAGLNNKLSGQITVRTSSSDQLQIALIAVLPIVKAIYKNFWPGASEKYSIY